MAEITFKRPDTMKAGTAKGFRGVAGYIFGKNRARGRQAAALSEPSEKMAMTAPVRTTLKADEAVAAIDELKVSFVMARDRELSSLPVPLESDVKLRTVPPHRMACRSFSGPPPSQERIAKLRAVVEGEVEKGGLKRASDEVLVYGYHDPFITPNLLRRNEVGVMVA